MRHTGEPCVSCFADCLGELSRVLQVPFSCASFCRYLHFPVQWPEFSSPAACCSLLFTHTIHRGPGPPLLGEAAGVRHPVGGSRLSRSNLACASNICTRGQARWLHVLYRTPSSCTRTMCAHADRCMSVSCLGLLQDVVFTAASTRCGIRSCRDSA